MRILALETSCDDTACAIVADGRRVLASLRYDQTDLHLPYGGVVPEMAARDHLLRVNACVDKTLEEAGLALADIDAFAATLGPGLIGSLLVGANTAKTLSLLTGKPFLGVNHLYAHVASNYLESNLEPPFLCLLVSGGHTQLIVVEAYDRQRIVGETLDDAVGEAYDKVARLLDLPYPGGPHLDALAQSGNPDAVRFPRARTTGPFDFSFSGVKTAVLRAVESAAHAPADVAASFQRTVVETLAGKTLDCLVQHGLTTLAIAGGVSANSALRGHFERQAASGGFRLYIPQMRFCTDNAAMVAASAFYNPITDDVSMEVFSRAAS